MRSITGKEFGKILERNGWTLIRTSGSHHLYRKAGIPRGVAVPVHAGRDLKIGILKGLMKAAGLTEEDLK